MSRSTIIAHIEGPIRVGVVIDTPDGTLCVEGISLDKDGSRSVLELDEIVTEEPARALYPVLCPACSKVFAYGVEPGRFITAKDMDRHEHRSKFFVMPGPCQECSSQ